MISSNEHTFLSEEITMLETSEGGHPVLFRWRDVEHKVTEITRQWQDWGFSTTTHKKDFKSRRHRNYYEIRTDQNFHGLLYFDRGVKPSNPRIWVIFEQYEN